MHTQVRVCPSCGVPLADAASFCHVCGAATPTGAYTQPASRDETRARLAAALGGEYVLRELLGSGGFAEVYLAWDGKLKREVAVKTLRADLTANHAIRERFRREAEAIAQLRHPHIVPIYSVADAGSQAWFVMPRIDGVTLAAAVARESHWSFAEVCRILRESAAALAAAHARGIVHRDVKPENIMLEGPERRVVVMDFGIAKSVDDVSSASLTGTGMMVGTPQYMSPEQVAGDVIGPASDQYSLGLIGYRLLAGRMPFEADSIRSVMAMQASMPPAPLRSLRPDVPAALARVIERALQKDPADRFESMQAMTDALDRVARDVAGEYRRGRRTIPMSERWTEARRRTAATWRLSMVTIVVAAIVIGFAMPRAFSDGLHRVLRERDDALLAARGMLAATGIRATPIWSRFIHDRSMNDFLHRQFPARVADSLAYAVYGVWSWEYDFDLADGQRWMYFGRDARLVREVRPLTDSLRIGEMSVAEAKSVADSVVRSHGLNPDSLDFRRVETTSYPKYTSHRILWHVKRTRIERAVDTAAAAVQVTVTGRTPSAFSQVGLVYGKNTLAEPARARMILTIAFPAVIILLGAMTLITLLRRLGGDVLQWRMALVIAAFLPAVWLVVGTLGGMVDSRGISALADGLTRQIPVQLSGWILSACCLVAGESLWYETRPDLTAGLDDLARGRFVVPELIPASLAGYAWGLGLAAAGIFIYAMSHVVVDRPFLDLPISIDAFQTHFAWAAPLLPLGFGTAACAIFLFFSGLLQRRRWSLPLLCIVAGLTMLTPFVLMFDLFTAIVLSALVALVPICVMRCGYAAGVLAIGIAFGVPMALDFLWAGGPFLAPGIIGLALLAVPGAWALRLRAARPA